MNNKELFVSYCLKFVGVPYKWGGDDPIHGFDCSGGVQEILAAFGCDPKGDQTSDALYRHFKKDGAGHTHLDTGAICFYGRESRITHVGIALNPNVMFEFGGGGSKTTDKESAAVHNAYGRIRPVRRRSDLVTAIIPARLHDYLNQ